MHVGHWSRDTYLEVGIGRSGGNGRRDASYQHHGDDEHEGHQGHERERDEAELPHIALGARRGRRAERRRLIREGLELGVVGGDERTDPSQRGHVDPHRPVTPQLAHLGVYNITVVELDGTHGEPVRVLTRVDGVAREQLVVGLPVVVDFEPLGDGESALPIFRPAGVAS